MKAKERRMGWMARGLAIGLSDDEFAGTLSLSWHRSLLARDP